MDLVYFYFDVKWLLLEIFWELHYWEYFENLLMKFSLRIIIQLLRGPYTLVGCKLYKCVAVVTFLALTWVWGVILPK